MVRSTPPPARRLVISWLVAALAPALLLLQPGPSARAATELLDPLAPAAGWLYDDSVTSMSHVRSVIGADEMHALGYTGDGVGVALVDTGVVPVPGLSSGDVVNGPDLSFESQSDHRVYLDSFGHGTHMAGIIAGDSEGSLLGLEEDFTGIAPDARLTSVKVGAHDGGVDVSQVIAAIDWVVEHKDDDPRHPIRVLNLSYGTDGTQDYRIDPLTHAVENAWRAGIVVVASGGNDGTSASQLNNPAYDPFVLAVGAADTAGTVVTADDTVPPFSSRGSASRRVDVVAPGRSIASLRSPGSFLDMAHPGARVGDHLFKGSGSSQAAAVVSGAVALLLEQRPDLTPDEVKALLRGTAAPLSGADDAGQGAGEIDLRAASVTAGFGQPQTFETSTGTGSVEEARGTQHVADGGVDLVGEFHVLGPWSKKWAEESTVGTAWEGGDWNRRTWTGDCWCATSWAGPAWSSVPWKGDSWAEQPWSGRSWPGHRWDGHRWDGDGWDGGSWVGHRWDGDAWG